MDYGLFIIIALVFLSFGVFIYFIWKYLVPKLNELTEKQQVVKEKIIESKETSLELLKMEFSYAMETSMQAQKDRLTMLNFYLGLYTAVFAGNIGLSEISNDLKNLIPFSFLILAFVSFIFILQVIRLRQSWYSSAKSMNLIKEYFFERDESLKSFIKWKSETLPTPEKFKTVSWLIAFLISVLGTISLGVGMILLSSPVILTVLVSLLFFLVCLLCYQFMLQYGV